MSAIRQESRLVRPFLRADDIKDALAGVALRIRPGEDATTDESRTVRQEDFGLLDPALALLFEPDKVAETLGGMGIKAKNVSITVLATSNAIRKSEVLATFDLHGTPNEEVSLPQLLKYVSGRGGCDLSVILALSADLKSEALKPHAYGQWLAKKNFALRPEKEGNQFRIRPLTDEYRDKFKLPKACFYFVEHTGSLNDADATLESCVTIWVAEAVFAALSKDNSSRSSAAIQKMMLAEVVVAIVEKEIKELDDTLLIVGAPLEAFLKTLAKHSKMSPDKLIALVRKDRFRFATFVQDLLDLGAGVKAAV